MSTQQKPTMGDPPPALAIYRKTRLPCWPTRDRVALVATVAGPHAVAAALTP